MRAKKSKRALSMARAGCGGMKLLGPWLVDIGTTRSELRKQWREWRAKQCTKN